MDQISRMSIVEILRIACALLPSSELGGLGEVRGWIDLFDGPGV